MVYSLLLAVRCIGPASFLNQGGDLFEKLKRKKRLEAGAEIKFTLLLRNPTVGSDEGA